MRLAGLVCAFSLTLNAQTYTLGTASDPCVGGSGFTVFQSALTVRYSNTSFTCTFPVSPDGLYTLELDFLEPCFAAGACSGGQVTAAGQRIENVYANQTPVLLGFDPFAAGATASTPAKRTMLAYSAGGQIVVNVQTVVRSAVLSGAVITQGVGTISLAPTAPPVTIPAGMGAIIFVDSADGRLKVAKPGIPTTPPAPPNPPTLAQLEPPSAGNGIAAIVPGQPIISIDSTVAQLNPSNPNVWGGKQDFSGASLVFPPPASLQLQAGTVAAGGTAALNLTFAPSSPVNLPAGLQWSFLYSTTAITSISAIAGPALAAANKTLTCAGTAGTYTCLAAGVNSNTIGAGVVATLSVTMASSATSTTIGVVMADALGATLPGQLYPVLAMGAVITVN
jgi:hypothetical protein